MNAIAKMVRTCFFLPPAQHDLAQSRCDAAKAQREETRRRVGLARTYDLIEQLDAMVRQACKAG